MLIGHTPNDHGGIGTSETKRIRQRNIDLTLACRLRHQVDRGFHRRIFQIDRWRNDVIANRKDTKDRLDRTSGTQQVAGRRFGRRDGELIRELGEDLEDRLQFGEVAEWRRRTWLAAGSTC